MNRQKHNNSGEIPDAISKLANQKEDIQDNYSENFSTFKSV